MTVDVPSVELWLLRHGETEWSAAMRHTGRTDVPLTEPGREQAAALAPLLTDVTWTAVLCSPLTRARQTLALAVPGVSATLLNDLRERDYGAVEGLTTEAVREHQPGWDSWTSPIDDAETIDAVGDRADRAIDRALEAGPDGASSDGAPARVLLVAHGHLLRILAARWLGLPAVFGAQLSLGSGGLSVLGYERERRALVRWNVGP